MPTEPDSPLSLDLNRTITSAVQARVEAEVLAALSGDATLAAMVAAALNQAVEVKDQRTYRTTTVPFLHKVLSDTLQAAAKAAVQKLVVEEADALEAEVRKVLRKDMAGIAKALTQSLTDAAGRGYGINVAIELRTPQS